MATHKYMHPHHMQRKSIFPVLTVAMALVLSLGYFTFFQNLSTNTDQLTASSGRILAELPPGGGVLLPGNQPANLTNGGNAPLSVPANNNTALRDPLGNQNSDLSKFLNTLLDKVIIPLGAIVVTIAIILAGFKYVTAKGDPKAIDAAHKQLTWTAVGAAVLLGAKAISMVITNTVNTLRK